MAVFLKQLGRSGNVRLAAEGAGVDFTTAYQRRKRHGEFAQAWEGALEAFAVRQAKGEGGLHEGPSTSFAGPPPRSGEELIAHPDGKLIRASEARWSPRKEEVFLLELTVSGSVKLAARATGFSTTAVYKRRLKDKRFAAAWEAAVETGKARVQAYLVEAATRTFDPDELPIGDEREIPKVSISEAINIAKLKGAGPAAAEPEEEYGDDYLQEVRERILEKLARLREREIEEGWTAHRLAVPLGEDESIRDVWLPPGYALVRIEDAEAGSTSARQA